MFHSRIHEQLQFIEQLKWYHQTAAVVASNNYSCCYQHVLFPQTIAVSCIEQLQLFNRTIHPTTSLQLFHRRAPVVVSFKNCRCFTEQLQMISWSTCGCFTEQLHVFHLSIHTADVTPNNCSWFIQ